MSQQQERTQGMKLGVEKIRSFVFHTSIQKHAVMPFPFNLEKDSVATGAKEEGSELGGEQVTSEI